MRLIKMFGLAMAAAVVAMAFVGVASASAQHALLGSILCVLGGGASGLCPTGSEPYTGALLALKGDKTLGISLFKNIGAPEFHIECQTEMHGNVSNAGGLEAHPTGLINEVKFTECVSPQCVHGVSAVASNLPWLVVGLGSAELSKGQIHVSKHEKGAGPPAGLFTCHTLFFGVPVLVECHYDVKEALGTVDNHTATTRAKLLVEGVVLLKTKGGASCPNEASWKYSPYLDPETLSIHLL